VEIGNIHTHFESISYDVNWGWKTFYMEYCMANQLRIFVKSFFFFHSLNRYAERFSLLNVTDRLFVYFLHNKSAVCLHFLQGRCTRDNFNELSSDDGLSASVVKESQFVNHLASILAGAVHGLHPRGLLGAGALFQAVVDQGS